MSPQPKSYAGLSAAKAKGPAQERIPSKRAVGDRLRLENSSLGLVMRAASLAIAVALDQVQAVFRLGLLEAAGLFGQDLGGRYGHRGAGHDERQSGGEKYFLKHKVTPVSDYASCAAE